MATEIKPLNPGVWQKVEVEGMDNYGEFVGKESVHSLQLAEGEIRRIERTIYVFGHKPNNVKVNMSFGGYCTCKGCNNRAMRSSCEFVRAAKADYHS